MPYTCWVIYTTLTCAHPKSQHAFGTKHAVPPATLYVMSVVQMTVSSSYREDARFLWKRTSAAAKQVDINVLHPGPEMRHHTCDGIMVAKGACCEQHHICNPVHDHRTRR